MKKEKYNVAIVGATGAVGREMLAVLEQRDFPIDELRPLASERSIGQTVTYRGKEIPVAVLDKNSFEGIDIALFSAGSSISKEYAPYAAEAGAVVIDNTSYFRLDPEVPLVVPEVNPEAVDSYQDRRIIANPNCSTIQLMTVLKPIQDAVGLERVVISTYQSTSGAGQKAIEELVQQVQALLSQQELTKKVFPHQIAFNCIPQIDVFTENRYTKEEMKMILESRKILGDENLRVTATCVRVPVFISHSESVNVQTKKKISVEDLQVLLSKAEGVTLKDDPSHNEYPLSVDAAGKDDVFVGRIRADESAENAFNLWIVSDNLRKGAALNAVQIAEILIKRHL